jgi:hypothetical protein
MSPGTAVRGEFGVQQEDSRPATTDAAQSTAGAVILRSRKRVTEAVKEKRRRLLEQQVDPTLKRLCAAPEAGVQLSAAEWRR